MRPMTIRRGLVCFSGSNCLLDLYRSHGEDHSPEVKAFHDFSDNNFLVDKFLNNQLRKVQTNTCSSFLQLQRPRFS